MLLSASRTEPGWRTDPQHLHKSDNTDIWRIVRLFRQPQPILSRGDWWGRDNKFSHAEPRSYQVSNHSGSQLRSHKTRQDTGAAVVRGLSLPSFLREVKCSLWGVGRSSTSCWRHDHRSPVPFNCCASCPLSFDLSRRNSCFLQHDSSDLDSNSQPWDQRSVLSSSEQLERRSLAALKAVDIYGNWRSNFQSWTEAIIRVTCESNYMGYNSTWLLNCIEKFL